MSKGISLHIGLNSVDPQHYAGWNGKLNACEADAKDLMALAQKNGFSHSESLLTEQATAGAILGAIGHAAQQLTAGDLFFLTYSGHGGKLADPTGEEADGVDETWVAYDRQLIGDELRMIWGKFASGVRILVFCDSGNSGTFLRDSTAARSEASQAPGAVPREIPRDVAAQVYAANLSLYQGIQWVTNPSAKTNIIQATILFIASCQDDQTALDGEQNGLFTGTLLRIWDDGKFTGNYDDLYVQLLTQMPSAQQPNLLRIGVPNQAFEHQRPFNTTLTVP